MSANSKLGEQLISLRQQQFTGILIVKSQDNTQWKLYFYLGKFLWAKGGVHINRSWKRHFQQYCSQVDISSLSLRNQNQIELHNYYLILVLFQRKLITREQLKALIESRVKEIFFDLLQKEYKEKLAYTKQPTSAHYLLKAGFNLSLAIINLEQMLFQAQQTWSAWGSKGLASCSPNLAPLIKNNEELQRQVPALIYHNMNRLLNSKHSLRDLAVKMDKDVLEVAWGLVPYFFKGYLRFLEIPDIPDCNRPT